MFKFCSLLLFLACSAPGQRVAVGIVAGGSPTEDFHNSGSPPILGVTPGFSTETAAKRYVLGVSLEFRPASTWSVEVDALYRPLKFVQSTVLIDGSRRSISPATVVTWEFPVLAKFRFPSVGAARPFLVAGPSLRTAGNLNGTRPSPYGFTGGLGAEIRIGSLRLAPSARYTRWAAESAGYSSARTKLDQVEVLMGISRPGEQLLGFGVSFALLLGSTLTKDYRPSPAPDRTVSGSRALISGLLIEAPLTERFAVETGAIYQPLLVRTDSGGSTRTERVNVTWHVPVLVKVRFPREPFTPFAAIGPSFRLPQSLNGATVANVGFAAEVGVESKVGIFRIFPAIRYTRWRQDSGGGRTRVSLDQVAVAVGIGL